MPAPTAEFREDWIHNRTVIIAPSRKARPQHDFPAQALPPAVSAKDCPFCPANIDPKLIVDQVPDTKTWRIASVKNRYPIVSRTSAQLYGDQEVIIETPDHNVELGELPANHLAALIGFWGQRVKTLAEDKRLSYILVFKNNGGRAGASIAHAHSQIFASEFLPPHVLEKLKRAEDYQIRTGNCYHCDLMRREKHGYRWITNDKLVAAFTPYASMYNYETWLMPWAHKDNVSLLSTDEINSMAKILKSLLQVVNRLGLPYNLYLHQVTRYSEEHFYIRIAPRRDVWAGIELGTRLIVNSVAPEEAADLFRKEIKKPAPQPVTPKALTKP